MIDPIRLEGLDIGAAMRRAATASSEAALEASERAAEIVVDQTRPLIPRGRTGAARASLKAMGASVSLGGAPAPYAPWLDFGGRVGVKKSVLRRFVPGGRYVWPTLDRETERINEVMAEALVQAVERAGIEVT